MKTIIHAIRNNRFNSIIYYCISGLFCLVLFLYRKADYELFLYIAAAIVIAYFFLSMLFIYWIKQEKILSLHSLFLLFIYIFNFGNLIVNLVSPDHEYRSYDFLHFYSSSANISAIIYTFVFVCLLTIGYIISFRHFDTITTKTYTKNPTLIDENHKALLIFAVLILAFSLPVELYISINKLIIGTTQGYLATYKFNVSGILIQISQFHFIGAIMLALAFKNDIKKVNFIYLVTILYEFVIMLSGNRGQQVIRICFLLLLYFNFFKRVKISIPKLVVLCIFSLVGLTILMNISKIRFYTFSDFSQYLNTLLFAGSNPIVSILDEFGYTLFTLSLCFGQMPVAVPFAKGLSYLASLVTIFPNINSFTYELNKIASFVPHLNIEQIGGSIIAETYYNFSLFGLLLAIPIGYLVVMLSNLLLGSLKEEKYYQFSFLILPATSLLWWVRDSFTNIPRMLVYSAIFLIFCKWLTTIIMYKIYGKTKKPKKDCRNETK